MKRSKIDRMEDHACPYCGRFYFLPDEELMGMRHAPRQHHLSVITEDLLHESVTERIPQ